jgi:hypothetical protein
MDSKDDRQQTSYMVLMGLRAESNWVKGMSVQMGKLEMAGHTHDTAYKLLYPSESALLPAALCEIQQFISCLWPLDSSSVKRKWSVEQTRKRLKKRA